MRLSAVQLDQHSKSSVVKPFRAQLAPPKQLDRRVGDYCDWMNVDGITGLVRCNKANWLIDKL
jgi:hypothetical protein